MGKLFNSDEYPLADIILNTQFMSGHNFKDDYKLLDLIYNECVYVVIENISDKREIEYFDYTLKFDKFGDKIKIIPNNMLTALWFINIFPKNGKDVLIKKTYTTISGTYKFDGRSKTLKLI